MKKTYKTIFQWGCALILSLLILNLFTLLFGSWSPAFLKRESGATRGVWWGNSTVICNSEGHGLAYVDSNGYFNDISNLVENGYVLLVGNSYTSAIQVSKEERYRNLLNDYLKKATNSPNDYIYTVSCDAYTLTDWIERFHALVSEYPNAETIVIQISDENFDYTVEELNSAVSNAIFFNPQHTGKALNENPTINNVFAQGIKCTFPFIIYYWECKHYDEFMNIGKPFLNANYEDSDYNEPYTIDHVDLASFESSVNNVFTMFQNEFSGNIVIINVGKEMNLDSSGNLISHQENEKEQLFDNIAKEYGIEYISMNNIFEEEYLSHKNMPYGYSNTSFGYGHLNKYGHQLVAQKLIQYFEARL